MLFSPRPISLGPGLALFLAVLLLPGPPRLPQRDLRRDLEALQQTECEYRGITTTFAELTRTYILEAYTEGRLLRWDVEPSCRNPDAETRVTAVFRVGSARPVVNPVIPDSIITLRQEGVPQVWVSWRYSTLASIHVDAANTYARDAIAVFRLTVDRFIAAMVVTTAAVQLRTAPLLQASTVKEVAANTVLLLSPCSAESTQGPGWSHVRIPSTITQGWVEADKLIAVCRRR